MHLSTLFLTLISASIVIASARQPQSTVSSTNASGSSSTSTSNKSNNSTTSSGSSGSDDGLTQLINSDPSCKKLCGTANDNMMQCAQEISGEGGSAAKGAACRCSSSTLSGMKACSDCATSLAKTKKGVSTVVQNEVAQLAATYTADVAVCKTPAGPTTTYSTFIAPNPTSATASFSTASLLTMLTPINSTSSFGPAKSTGSAIGSTGFVGLGLLAGLLLL